jgi:hypothetical protein
MTDKNAHDYYQTRLVLQEFEWTTVLFLKWREEPPQRAHANREFKLPVSDGSSSPVCRTLCDVIVETRYATLLLLPGKPEPLGFLFKYG